MSLIDEYAGKVDYWKNSSQKHRWVATALLEIEPRLHNAARPLWEFQIKMIDSPNGRA